jgi:CBS domain-containing protein
MVYKFHFPTTKVSNPRLKELMGSLIAVAGLVYPLLTGIIIKVAGRQIWIPGSNVQRLSSKGVLLGSASLDIRDFKPRQGEVRLVKEVLDHQLIDVNGARVVRATELYIADISGKPRLVGVDVGLKPLFRRLGPKSLRVKVIPDAVIDWATIQSFGSQDDKKQELHLSANRQELRRMRPGELADLLEDLGRTERQKLLDALTPEQAADALEEMEPEELEAILRESSPKEAAKYLARMEPDEAADGLRDVDWQLREKLLAMMPREQADKVKAVLAYDEATAGGIMNTELLTAPSTSTVKDLKQQLKSLKETASDLEAVAITDKKGKLLYDLPLADLLIAKDSDKLEQLMKPPATLTVQPDASLKEVAERLVESRSASIVVTDKKEHPLGRIFADDMIDVLIPTSRFHFPRLLS